MTTTPSRRAVLRAGAWAAPVVAVVAATPAFAASTTGGLQPTATYLSTGSARVGVSNTSATDLLVTYSIPVNAYSLVNSITPGGWTLQSARTGYTMTHLVPAGLISSSFTIGWSRLSGDGRVEMFATAAGVPSQALVLPWVAPR